MLTYPGFDPVAFSLGPLQVRWYGLTYVIAFAAACPEAQLFASLARYLRPAEP